ncbi:hypothetical protein D3C85_1455570 [compost metagenome]
MARQGHERPADQLAKLPHALQLGSVIRFAQRLGVTFDFDNLDRSSRRQSHAVGDVDPLASSQNHFQPEGLSAIFDDPRINLAVHEMSMLIHAFEHLGSPGLPAGVAPRDDAPASRHDRSDRTPVFGHHQASRSL